MSLRQAERDARYALMFPSAALANAVCAHEANEYESAVFDEFQLSEDARAMALYSARQHAERAAAIYRAIARTRGPWCAA